MANHNLVKQQLFDYVVLYHPTEEEVKDGKTTSVILRQDSQLEKNIETLQVKIHRAIPGEFIEKYNQLEVIIRPF